jgi:hypothetical protein
MHAVELRLPVENQHQSDNDYTAMIFIVMVKRLPVQPSAEG